MGHISTVIASYTTDEREDVQSNTYRGKMCHECKSSCDCSGIDPGQFLPCPYFHTCCVGKIVALTRYGIICENMAWYDNQQLADFHTTDIKTYIVFSLTDAIYLGNRKGFVSEKRTGSDVEKLMTGFKETVDDTSNGCDGIGNDLENKIVPQQQMTLEKDFQRDCEDGAKGHMLTSIKSNSVTLHRHSLENGGIYFCRRKECCPTTSDTKTHEGEIQTKFANNHIQYCAVILLLSTSDFHRHPNKVR